MDNQKIAKATKWSAVTEVAAKLVAPVASIILARVLTPEAFGIVATLTMIITFAEIFTDAGFQKYLVQHEFADEADREQSTTVAFWSNLAMSLLLWGVIAAFSEPLASLVGNPGYGFVLAIACVSIPLTAFSSIQTALFKRDLDFRTLFKARLTAIAVPLLVTVPLAFWMRSYWALVIGTIVQNAVSAATLTAFSKWKPRLFYSWAKLREMLSFSVWSMVEAVSIWLTSYLDIFIVSRAMDQYYLGLYKTSISIVTQVLGLVTATTTPVLFSALSRLQSDEEEFRSLFFRFQKYVALMVIPLGVGMFFYSDLVTRLLLGSQWMETSGFIGLWALTGAFVIVLSHYSSEVYRAKGRPRLSVLAQVLHIVVLLPAVLIAVRYGYEALYITRSLVRLEMILVNLTIMYVVVRMSPWKMLSGIGPSCIAAAVMGAAAWGMLHGIPALLSGDASALLSGPLSGSASTALAGPLSGSASAALAGPVGLSGSLLYQAGTVLVCIGVYVAVICVFPEERKLILSFRAKSRPELARDGTDRWQNLKK